VRGHSNPRLVRGFVFFEFTDTVIGAMLVGHTSRSKMQMFAQLVAQRSNAWSAARRLLEQRVGRVSLITDGCMECGACRIVRDEFHNVDRDYPRCGFGILYKFG
jgi:ferredoxin-like protein FixX